MYQNEYSISDTQQFPDMLSNLPPLKDDEENVSCAVYSLFTNILLKDTIEYIIKLIYTHKKWKSIWSKLIFKRLLLKLATECTYTFNHKFYKQIDGCTIGGPLSVTFSDKYMIKMDSAIVVPPILSLLCWWHMTSAIAEKSLIMMSCFKS